MEELEEYYTDPKDENVAIKLNNLTTAWDVVEKQPTGEQKEEVYCLYLWLVSKSIVR